MPLYEYKASQNASCDFCKNGFEFWQRIDDPPMIECPVCDAPIAKVLAPFSVGRGDILTASNVTAHGVTRLRRTDTGMYEPE